METTEKIRFMPIFNAKLAGRLLVEGFVLLDLRENTNGSGKKVFYFKDSPVIQEKLKDFINKSK